MLFRSLCGIEPEVDIELLNMTQKNKNEKKIDKNEEPLQRLIERKGKEKQKQKERDRETERAGGSWGGYVLTMYIIKEWGVLVMCCPIKLWGFCFGVCM